MMRPLHLSPLLRLLVERFWHGALLLFVLSLLSFGFAELAPGDLVSQLELDPRISSQTVDALRTRYALDQPLLSRYGHWLASLGSGDLGYSVSYQMSVAQLVGPRLLNTLILTATATVLAWGLALLFGSLASRYREGWLDRLVSGLNSALMGMPDLLLALAALWLAARTGLFPVSGMTSLEAEQLPFIERLLDRLWHLALPAGTLALGLLPGLVAHVRQALVDAEQAPFVDAARGHGISKRRIFWRYTLRSAANPLVQLFGMSLGTLLSGSLIVEIVLAWPGLGPLLYDGILARDTHLVIAGALLAAFGLLLGNLLADVLLWHLDPRLRHPAAPSPAERLR